MWSNFAKYSRRDVTLLDTGYDYLSLMHYPVYAFSKNGGQTIGPRYQTYEEPGTRNDFSYVDIYRITALYRCGGNQPGADPYFKEGALSMFLFIDEAQWFKVRR